MPAVRKFGNKDERRVSSNQRSRERYAAMSPEKKEMTLAKRREAYRRKKQNASQTALTIRECPLLCEEAIAPCFVPDKRKLKQHVSEFSVYETGSSSKFSCDGHSGQDQPPICKECHHFLVETLEDVTGFSCELSSEPQSSHRPQPEKKTKAKSSAQRRYNNRVNRRSVSKEDGERATNGTALLSFISEAADELPAAPDCQYCHAKRFHSESRNFCCSDGEVLLKENKLPDVLVELYTGNTEEAICFRTYVRTYNCLFAFTSFGVAYDRSLCKRDKGIYSFRVQGQTYHFINELLPHGGNGLYLQLYFHDTEHELENRMAFSNKLTESIVLKLMKVMQDNPYACFFRSLRSVPNLDSYQIVLRTDCQSDQRVFNKPSVSQIAALWIEGEDIQQGYSRHIRVYTQQGHSQRIQYYYGCYDPLQYPLLYPLGETGWHAGIKRSENGNPKKRKTRVHRKSTNVHAKKAKTADELISNEEQAIREAENSKEFVSMREYYAYKFQMRANNVPNVLNTGRELLQYAVDMYVKIETQRLEFFRSKQREIRTEQLQGIMDSVSQGESRGSHVGQRVVLPATFIGGPRDMKRRYMDAMALVQRFGKPDLFLTMTCNNSWKEIKDHLLPSDEAANRCDLHARVFHAKLNALKDELFKKEIFGQVAAYTYVVEFQKRGLPHAHFLIILKPNSKLYSIDSYDQIVSAELPDKEKFPHLYRMVRKHMMHGPCGSDNPENVCMRNGQCKNKYPKAFAEQTTHTVNAYPEYRRRNDGRYVIIRGQKLDNRWVVPYNAYLLAKFNCHINVEICSTIKVVKYMYKYIYKGHDRIKFQLNPDDSSLAVDEIKQYQSARWVGTAESMWKIYRFSLYEMKPSVIRLQLHLENFQPLTFDRRANLENVLRNPAAKQTMLTEFFRKNATDSEAEDLALTYKEFPEYYVWLAAHRIWEKRQQRDVIGRIVTANPSEGERYFLRLLLQNVRAPKSFDDLRTVNGVYVQTFREAAMLRGLFESDNPQEQCLDEASVYGMPRSLRRLFATILVYFPPANAKHLWQKFESSMSEDIQRIPHLSLEEVQYRVLHHINDVLVSMGKNINSFGLVPRILKFYNGDGETRDTTSETQIKVTDEDLAAIQLLNSDQRAAFDTIVNAVYKDKKGCFFVDGPGGIGKTFLYKALLAEVRSKGDIALATASCGVAASILPGGRTAHSRFKIPIDTDGSNVCRIGKQTALAKLLQQARLIIWDEAPMANKICIEAVNDLLKDLMDSKELFGSKIMVFGGDFRQVLPVITNGGKNDFIQASLVKSHVWQHLHKLYLTENMRAKSDPSFMEYLLAIGNGTQEKIHSDYIRIPSSFLIPYEDEQTSLLRLISEIYPSFDEFFSADVPALNKAILTTKNDFVDYINETLIEKFPGQAFEYVSRDKTLDVSDQATYEDFLNSLIPNGFPPHQLRLKPNCPVILLRNIDPPEGLCNGTRLIVRSLRKNVIDAVISSGTEFAGKQVFLHRIQFRTSTDANCPIPFERTQFPIRLCFAMTINKAQGQTLDSVGIYLREPVFSHGQLYVAMSRARDSRSVKILIRPPFCDSNLSDVTKNVVYEEVLEMARRQ